MKKNLLIIAFSCLSIIGMAQTDIVKFLGIPVDGSKREMIQKLRTKGFSYSLSDNDILTGRFNGKDVQVYIGTNNDKVCRIMLCDENLLDEINIKIRFNILCEQFKNNSKYCSFSEDDQKISDDEDISYEMMVNKKRYEAIFYQIPDTTAENYNEDVKALLYSKYTQEQLNNPSEEISKDIYNMFATNAVEKTLKKPVWFMISESYGKYYISMYYDNEYNRANGEDL